MERTLVQYLARMSDRCTPFGLFAGVSVGEVGGAATRLRLAGRERYRRRSTLDLGQMSHLVGRLLEDRAVREGLRYWPNDTLARVGGRLQYVERGERDGRMRHEVASLEPDEPLEAVLRRAARGARPGELRAAVREEVPEAEAAECREYVDALIEAQVIEPDLIPAVVGPDPLDQILEILGEAPGGEKAVSRVRRLRRSLDEVDARGVGAPPKAYKAVEAVWSGDLGLRPHDRLLQVDLFKEAEDLRLSQAVVEAVLRGGERLWRLGGPPADELQALKSRFRDRFEGRELPLAEAFDPECGLGAPGADLRPLLPASPLLRGLPLGAAQGPPGGRGDRQGKFAAVLASRLLDFGGGSRTPLELDDELLERLAPGEPPPLPDALVLHFDLLATSEDAVCRGAYRIYYHGAVGPSGARMLGRFCDLDEGLLDGVRRHLREEAALDPDAIYAEIVHTPEGRLGNVVRRPHVREVELSLAGHSRFRGKTRLTLDDLLLSLDGNRFRLRSRRDGREVRPRLTSAHNFSGSTGMYRFLCALQHDGIRPGLGWGWGQLAGLPFLPRVIRGRAIYALARWRLAREQPAYAAIARTKTREDRTEAARRLVEERGLPRLLRLVDGDNRLLLDLDNALSRAVFEDHAARRPVLTVEEVLDEDIEGCVSGPEGKYRHEILLPLVRREARKPTEPFGAHGRGPSSDERRRVFPPGSEWLFFKLYCAPATTDRLLRDVAAPLMDLHRELTPDWPWFFVRYSDPEHHLRLRFQGGREARRALEDRMAELAGGLVERGVVHRMGLDTYVRETERYGGVDGIGLSERWFRADSEAALDILAVVHDEEDEDLRWQAALMGFDRLLRDFGLDFGGRAGVVGKSREAFGQEFGVGAETRKRLAGRLRRERARVEGLVTGPLGGDSAALKRIEACLAERSSRTAATLERLRELDASGRLGTAQDELLRSFMHMHANRLLEVSARAQELVIHDFLFRTYRSLEARQGR